MRTEAQREFIARLRGYAQECGAGATLKRRWVIEAELNADRMNGLIDRHPPLDLSLRRWSRTCRLALSNTFMAWAMRYERLWKEAPTMPLLAWPLEGGPDAWPITRSSQEHVDFGESPAVDFAGPGILGAECVAALDGIVTTATYVGGQYGPGWIIEITGDLGDGHEARVGYCHLGEDAGPSPFRVAVGDFVEKGQPLGPAGFSGWCIPEGPDGAHLHLKCYQDGERVDPAPYLVAE